MIGLVGHVISKYAPRLFHFEALCGYKSLCLQLGFVPEIVKTSTLSGTVRFTFCRALTITSMSLSVSRRITFVYRLGIAWNCVSPRVTVQELRGHFSLLLTSFREAGYANHVGKQWQNLTDQGEFSIYIFLSKFDLKKYICICWFLLYTYIYEFMCIYICTYFSSYLYVLFWFTIHAANWICWMVFSWSGSSWTVAAGVRHAPIAGCLAIQKKRGKIQKQDDFLKLHKLATQKWGTFLFAARRGTGGKHERG